MSLHLKRGGEERQEMKDKDTYSTRSKEEKEQERREDRSRAEMGSG